MKISKTVFNLQSGHKYMVEIVMFNVQRKIRVKLRFMSSACRIIEL